MAGEVGRMGQVKYIESTESKIYRGDDLASNSRTLQLSAAATATATVSFDGGTVASGALVGRYVLIGGYKYYVKANTTNSLTLQTEAADGTKTDASITAADNTYIYPGEGGAEGISVYTSLVLGANAYGVTNVEGGALEHIVHQLGSGGTSDPLNQRATAGWKLTKAVCRLVEEYMVRIESSSTFVNQAAN
ncbi:MAG: hypothetical protein K6G85_00155 [Eubacterium sp.]|nr:hypothetical protein [Eubacterium sp.]